MSLHKTLIIPERKIEMLNQKKKPCRKFGYFLAVICMVFFLDVHLLPFILEHLVLVDVCCCCCRFFHVFLSSRTMNIHSISIFAITAKPKKVHNVFTMYWWTNDCSKTVCFFNFREREKKAIKQSFICICTLKREQMTGEYTEEKKNTDYKANAHYGRCICWFVSFFCAHFVPPNRITKNTSKRNPHTNTKNNEKPFHRFASFIFDVQQVLLSIITTMCLCFALSLVWFVVFYFDQHVQMLVLFYAYTVFSSNFVFFFFNVWAMCP